MLFGVYLILNGLERFSIEKIRINTTYTLFGNEITQAEIISSCLIVLGLSIVFYLRRNSALFLKKNKPVKVIAPLTISNSIQKGYITVGYNKLLEMQLQLMEPTYH